MLDNSSVHHGQRSNDETERDTRYGPEPNAQATEDGVHQGFQDRNEHDNGNRVEVLHQIVGNAVSLHLTSLGDKVAGELAVNDPVNGIEAEYAASDKGTLKLINKVVVPGNMGSVATILGLPSGFGGIHVAVDDHDPESLEGVGDDRSLRRTDDVELASANDNSSTNCKHAQAEQVSGPESNIPLHVRCSQQREGSEVDTAIEDHVNALNRKRRVNNNSLALLSSRDRHLLALILVRNLEDL